MAKKLGTPAVRPLQSRLERRRRESRPAVMWILFFKGCRLDVIFEGDCVANRFCPIAVENLIF